MSEEEPISSDSSNSDSDSDDDMIGDSAFVSGKSGKIGKTSFGSSKIGKSTIIGPAKVGSGIKSTLVGSGGKPKKPLKFANTIGDEEEDDDDDDDDEDEEDDDDGDIDLDADADSDAEDDDNADPTGDEDIEVVDEEDARRVLRRNMGDSMGDTTDDDDDDDNDDEDEDEYFRKFDESLKTNVIQQYHPDILQHNYEEVEAMTTITYKNGIIDDPLHRTLPFLTKYEKARVLGERARQLNTGAKPFVATNEGVIDGYLIALKELEEKKIPFIIRRPLPSGAFEYWKLKDLEML